MPRRSNAQFREIWSGATLRERARFHLVRWAPLLAVALLTYCAFPPHVGVGTPVPRWGRSPSATVVAPFAFEVRKSPEEIAREGESRALTAQPVYRFSPTAYDSSLAAARGFFADLERAGRGRGPDSVEAVCHPGPPGPGGDPVPRRLHQPAAAAGGVHPLPGGGALPRRGRRGRHPGRGEPDDRAAPGRDRARSFPAIRSSPSPI